MYGEEECEKQGVNFKVKALTQYIPVALLTFILSAVTAFAGNPGTGDESGKMVTIMIALLAVSAVLIVLFVILSISKKNKKNKKK